MSNKFLDDFSFDSLLGKLKGAFELENLKSTLSAIGILLGIGVVAVTGIMTIPDYIEAKRHQHIMETCQHEDLDYYSCAYDFDAKTVTILCTTCHRKLTFDIDYSISDEFYRAPTCQREGFQIEVWEADGHPDTRYERYVDTPMIPHDIEVEHEAYEPTCTESGSTEMGTCKICGNYISGKYIAPLGHDYAELDGIAPTCTVTGITPHHACRRCGHTDNDQEIIPMVDHQYVEGIFEATYESSGYIGEGCVVCGAPKRIDELHSAPLAVEYFEYEISSEGDYITITAIKKIEAEMTIPSHIDGIPVQYLADGLFAENQIIESITLSDGLLEIGQNVFYSCQNLREVTFSRTLQHIGDYAFDGCKSLVSLKIPSGIIGEYAFADCSYLRTVELGRGVTELSLHTFKDCWRLLCVRFSPRIEKIGNAFNLDYYGDIKIPYVYGPTWFENTTSIVAHNLLSYTAEDKVYYEDGFWFATDEEGRKVLLAYDDLDGEILIIPDGTEVLAAYANARSSYIEAMIIPTSIKELNTQRANFKMNYYFMGGIEDRTDVTVRMNADTYDTYYAPNEYYRLLQGDYVVDLWKMDEDGNITILEKQRP